MKHPDLSYLWLEYKEKNPDGYQLTQFYKHYNDFVKEHYGNRKLSMPVERVPREKLYRIEKGDRILYSTKSVLDKEIKKIAEKAGLPTIRVHDLRHSHASMLIEMGFPPLEIADRLGHESVKTTLDTYSHLYPDKDQQLADRLNRFRRANPAEKETP